MRDVYADTPGSDRYAGFWIRVGANVIDVLILAAFNQALLLATGGWRVFGGGEGMGIGAISLVLGSADVVVAGVVPPLVIVGRGSRRGDPGKLMLGLRTWTSRPAAPMRGSASGATRGPGRDLVRRPRRPVDRIDPRRRAGTQDCADPRRAAKPDPRGRRGDVRTCGGNRARVVVGRGQGLDAEGAGSEGHGEAFYGQADGSPARTTEAGTVRMKPDRVRPRPRGPRRPEGHRRGGRGRLASADALHQAVPWCSGEPPP